MPESPTASSNWPVHCHEHRDAPAVSLCTQCGRFLCRQCRSLSESGLALCSRCDPERQASPENRVQQPPQGFIGHAWTTARMALMKPAELVRSAAGQGELAFAIKFGLMAIILGKLAFLAWILLLQRQVYLEAIAPLAEQLDMSVKSYQLLQVFLLPLDALARLALFGLLLRLGVRLAAGPDRSQYRDFVRIISYASAGYFLLILPLFVGMALSFAYIIYICYRTVKERFTLSAQQAAIAVLPMALALLFLEFMGGF